MNLFKRAVLYIARKWKKSIVIFFIIFSVSALVISGFAILDAQEEKSVELRGTTGSSFTISRNTSTGGWNDGAGGNYSTQEFLDKEKLENISKVDGIDGYNASSESILCLSDSSGKYLEKLNPVGYDLVDCQFYSFGCFNSEYHSLFLSGELSMYDGTHIDSTIDNGIIISKDMADKHGINVGDTILAVNDPLSDDETIDIVIVGLFDIVADKTDEKNNYNPSSYYDYTNYAFVSGDAMKTLIQNYSNAKGYDSADFFVSDPEQLEVVIQNVQNISSIDWNNFLISANNEVYEQSAGSMSNVSTLIVALITIVIIISVAIIVIILSMWVKSRKQEIGILLAVGVTKIEIVMQFLFEVIIISFVAFPSSYLFSTLIASNLGELFGKSVESITVTGQNFTVVATFGILILMCAVIISSLPVMKRKPKEILTQME